jgi:hypothetical protein
MSATLSPIKTSMNTGFTLQPTKEAAKLYALSQSASRLVYDGVTYSRCDCRMSTWTSTWCMSGRTFSATRDRAQLRQPEDWPFTAYGPAPGAVGQGAAHASSPTGDGGAGARTTLDGNRTGLHLQVEAVIEPRNLNRLFDQLIPAAGVRRASGFHDLRHTCASQMLAQGTDLCVVSEVLGHSSVAITKDMYGHWSRDRS